MRRKSERVSLDWGKPYTDCLEKRKMLLELKKGIIYGPVNSRRLGRSLGINILPSSKKVCPFNCVYCQYGWTKVHTTKANHRSDLPSVKQIGEALKKALNEMTVPPAYITFSGNGEPTVHPDFTQIVDEVTALRDKMTPKAKTAVLSNSALAADLSAREALLKLDVRIMKLDCGLKEIFKRYNQPCQGVELEDITKGLAKLSELSDVAIQTLLSSGPAGNLDSQNISAWIERLKMIRPSLVQLYTLDRGYPAANLKPAAKEELNRIKAQVQEAGISVSVF